jgi:diguanylate cyclase (GGDEF)-like protein
MRPRPYPSLLLMGVALTLAALALRPYLPERRLDVLTLHESASYLFPAGPENKLSKVDWVDRSRLHFRCNIATGENAACSLVFSLSGKTKSQGIDLSRYDRLLLKIHYSGTAQYLRLAIRNFDPRFSNEKDDNSPKFNNMNLSSRDLAQPLEINLSEFSVPEWWYTSYNLKREYQQPDLSNATTLSIDLLGKLDGVQHAISIDQMEFVGEWVSSEHWYLGIIYAWLVGAILSSFVRMQHQHRRQVQALKASNLELQVEKDRFRQLSTVDALTDAYNRHGIELIVESLDLQDSVISLVMVDVDHFKLVNDQRGHDAGDRVLQGIARMLLQGTRAPAKVGRWGGEEFVLICPNTTTAEAVLMAERLRQRVAETDFEPDQPLAVTASFGVATLQPGEILSQALKRADLALYRAKTEGRNRVVADSP